MATHNAPLTPPITESDARQMSAGQVSANVPSAAGAQHASTIYLDVFPSISNLAIQNHLSDLIQISEDTELNADSGSRVDEARLLLVGPLVLSYLITNDLPPARIVLSRLPENLAGHPFTRSLLKLVAAVQSREYPRVYKSSDELLALVRENFFDSSLAAIVKVLVERHINAFRTQTMLLIAKAYTSLSSSLAQSYLNLPEDSVHRALQTYGWSYDVATKQLFPPSRASLKSSSSYSESASSLFTVRSMIGASAQLDTGALA